MGQWQSPLPNQQQTLANQGDNASSLVGRGKPKKAIATSRGKQLDGDQTAINAE
ncbi:hypothetical protein LIN78_03835 [Leeia sp. TBRC 13508]|uniref:Uncharacterized protein n=1 Tax=Leeia speluncae TaxID=2884804 RepID=A0ABS8D3U9_9NEIS|nr:hypothetical protein [Leeia speluncae]MCB6182683.1 hypothetical protein [Leeia speluncae]